MTGRGSRASRWATSRSRWTAPCPSSRLLLLRLGPDDGPVGDGFRCAGGRSAGSARRRTRTRPGHNSRLGRLRRPARRRRRGGRDPRRIDLELLLPGTAIRTARPGSTSRTAWPCRSAREVRNPVRFLATPPPRGDSSERPRLGARKRIRFRTSRADRELEAVRQAVGPVGEAGRASRTARRRSRHARAGSRRRSRCARPCRR
jgi:hypothetical protein